MPTPHEILDVLLSALATFRDDGEGAIAKLVPIYDEQVRFQDPLQSLVGREAFLEMNRRLLARSKELTFDVKESAVAGDQIFATWHMRMVPRVGPTLVVDGVTHARVAGGLVVEHRDYWDLLGSVLDSFPIVAPIYKTLVAKLA